jgi:uncharacterized membrane protein
MNPYTPQSIAQYLDMLKDALKGADASLVRDALYDAEEYLRGELAANPGVSEADLLAQIVGSYGAPEEVADIYRDTEVTVQKAMAVPKQVKSSSALKRFFGVAVDPHTYGAMFYMLLSLVTGIFYFTWATTGLSMSAGLMILIIGIPFFILFMASVYAISLIEGRLVETLLGVRMPRRPVYQTAGRGWMERIKALFADSRTWLSLMYMVLMLPLGVIYFSITVTLLTLSAGFVAAPVLWWLAQAGWISFHGHLHMGTGSLDPAIASPFLFVGGIVLLFASLHLIRFIGRCHGRLAKHLLVEAGGE